MIKEFVNTFNEREKDLEEYFLTNEPSSYYDIVDAVVRVLHGDTLIPEGGDDSHDAKQAYLRRDASCGLPNPEGITEIEGESWSGTLLYLIAADVPMPREEDYWFVSIDYGSCSYCDALQQIWTLEDKRERVKDYMFLAIGVVEGMKRLSGQGFYGNATNISWIARDYIAAVKERRPDIEERLENAAWAAGGIVKRDVSRIDDRVRHEVLAMLARKPVVPSHKKGDVIEECVSRLQNALRYVIVLPHEDFIEHYWAAHEGLRGQGFAFVSSENRFMNGDDAHRIGVIAHLRDEDGFVFEVQFHTQASYEYALVARQFSDIDEATDFCFPLRTLRNSLELPKDVNLSIQDMRESALRARGWPKARKPKQWKDSLAER